MELTLEQQLTQLNDAINALPNQCGLRLAEINNIRQMVSGAISDLVEPEGKRIARQIIVEVSEKVNYLMANPASAGKNDQIAGCDDVSPDTERSPYYGIDKLPDSGIYDIYWQEKLEALIQQHKEMIIFFLNRYDGDEMGALNHDAVLSLRRQLLNSLTENRIDQLFDEAVAEWQKIKNDNNAI